MLRIEYWEEMLKDGEILRGVAKAHEDYARRKIRRIKKLVIVHKLKFNDFSYWFI